MPNSLKLSQLIGSLSYALDMTEGQPAGHCVRCCWIGTHIGRELMLPEQEMRELYYTLLLKDLGCSSNAARICELYLADDLSFKRDFKLVNGSLPKVLNFVIGHTGLGANLADRFRAIFTIFREGDDIAQELIQTRCQRGADIARRLRFSEAVAEGIHCLDEHWDGTGRPGQRIRTEIPLYSQIALLSQVIDVFFMSEGDHAALEEATARAGAWFDPALVDAFRSVARDGAFWTMLRSPEIDRAVFELEPGQAEVALDEDYLDEIAVAFGEVVDAKSPYTAGHSARVALYTDVIAEAMGLPEARRRWLKRGALLHDVGKLGVSNLILDKPGKLDSDEWHAVQMHAAYTEEILCRIPAFRELAVISGAHHERLDGKGYPHGLSGEQISLETRIITTADIFDAITAERPYRGAIPLPKALDMMAENVGTAIDAECFAALKRSLHRLIAVDPEAAALAA
ncbi:HD-GYP domain-containing protein [Nitrogeniibacter aestuarii]|uniref:HD-GYP domain-containing protein n=1 Tax=Nitrogeniibacter aestuarii TaxID=2815343 RepID=UPI001E3CBC78|nr:HD-GYP domain-containing protein [Nitrogeniibacter aestuarii]